MSVLAWFRFRKGGLLVSNFYLHKRPLSENGYFGNWNNVPLRVGAYTVPISGTVPHSIQCILYWILDLQVLYWFDSQRRKRSRLSNIAKNSPKPLLSYEKAQNPKNFAPATVVPAIPPQVESNHQAQPASLNLWMSDHTPILSNFLDQNAQIEQILLQEAPEENTMIQNLSEKEAIVIDLEDENGVSGNVGEKECTAGHDRFQGFMSTDCKQTNTLEQNSKQVDPDYTVPAKFMSNDNPARGGFMRRGFADHKQLAPNSPHRIESQEESTVAKLSSDLYNSKTDVTGQDAISISDDDVEAGKAQGGDTILSWAERQMLTQPEADTQQNLPISEPKDSSGACQTSQENCQHAEKVQPEQSDENLQACEDVQKTQLSEAKLNLLPWSSEWLSWHNSAITEAYDQITRQVQNTEPLHQLPVEALKLLNKAEVWSSCTWF